jgi:uncharacterized glyoxalase superfamily protein PhnB
MGNLSPTLAVRNMAATIGFYSKTLGFKVGMTFPDLKKPEYADLSRDGMVLMFVPAKSQGINARSRLGVGVNLYLEIDGDIDKYYHELQKKGVKIIADIKDEPFGIRDFTVEDGDGYKLTFNRPIKKSGVCASCGMTMVWPEDFGGATGNKYCPYCSNPDGSLKSREEVLEGMAGFMMKSQGLDRKAAVAAAKKYMATMPAWK